MRALEVARRRQGDDVLAVGDAEHRELRPRELLLEDDRGAAAPEAALDQHRIDRGARFVDARADDDSLASRQSIRFHGDLPIALTSPGARPRGIREDGEVGRGNRGPGHQVLGERLARLDAARTAIWTEDVEARAAQRIANTRIHSRFGPEHDQAEALALREIDDADHVGSADRYVSRHPPRAAVARCAVDAFDQVRLHTLPDQRVLARPRPDDENLQLNIAIAAGVTI